MVGFAQDLYNQTRRIKEGPNHFSDVVRVAEKLLGRQLTIPATVLASPALKGKRPADFAAPLVKGAAQGKGSAPAAKSGKAQKDVKVVSRLASKVVPPRPAKATGRLAAKPPIKAKARRRVGAAR